jgi:hypothetical protein
MSPISTAHLCIFHADCARHRQQNKTAKHDSKHDDGVVHEYRAACSMLLPHYERIKAPHPEPQSFWSAARLLRLVGPIIPSKRKHS